MCNVYIRYIPKPQFAKVLSIKIRKAMLFYSIFTQNMLASCRYLTGRAESIRLINKLLINTPHELFIGWELVNDPVHILLIGFLKWTLNKAHIKLG